MVDGPLQEVKTRCRLPCKSKCTWSPEKYLDLYDALWWAGPRPGSTPEFIRDHPGDRGAKRTAKTCTTPGVQKLMRPSLLSYHNFFAGGLFSAIEASTLVLAGGRGRAYSSREQPHNGRTNPHKLSGGRSMVQGIFSGSCHTQETVSILCDFLD